MNLAFFLFIFSDIDVFSVNFRMPWGKGCYYDQGDKGTDFYSMFI